MRRFAADSFEFDHLEIQEDEETLRVPAVVAHEIVQEYDLAGERVQVYKPREELEKAAFTADNAWIVESHPDIGIVRDPEDIRGTVRNAEFVEGKIKGDLIFFKNRCPPVYIEGIKNGKIRSVSIGFLFDLEKASGDFQGSHYDYIQRRLFIDHVAVAHRPGRCPYPICGIGVDFFAAGDPYPNEHSCRLRDPGGLDIVGSQERKTDGKSYRVIFGKPKGKPKAGSVEQAYRYPTKSWSEAEARKHCNSHDGSFEAAKEEGGDRMVDDELSVEEIREKLAELSKERSEIMSKLYPEAELSSEEKEELQQRLTVIDAELKAYEEALAEKIGSDEDEREKLHEAAEARTKKYGIKFREGEGHLTPPEGYPEDVRLYADPVNYKYPLDTEKRCRNALQRWGQFREEYSPKERGVIYGRIVKRALKLGIEVKWDAELPEAKSLPTEIKEQLKGYETAADMVQRVEGLIDQLRTI